MALGQDLVWIQDPLGIHGRFHGPWDRSVQGTQVTTPLVHGFRDFFFSGMDSDSSGFKGHGNMYSIDENPNLHILLIHAHIG